MAGQKKRKALHAARQEALRNAEGVRLDVDPAEALQEVLDRSVLMLRYAQSEADHIKEDAVFEHAWTAEGKLIEIPNKWLRLETDLRQEVASLAGRMVQLGIADRAVQVQEAKAALLVAAITDAAKKAGISREQVKKLGPALRESITVLSGAGEGDGKPAGELARAS